MANKQLTAKVRIDASQAHKTIDKLVAKINKINEVVNKSSGTSGLEKKIERQLLQQEKLKQATLKTQLAEEKVTTQKNKSALAAQKVNEATIKTQIAEERLALQVERTRSGIERIKNALNSNKSSIDAIVSKMGAWASGARSTNSTLGSIWSKLKGIASTYLGIMGMRATIRTSDTITKAQNKLNNINGGDTALTQEQMDKMYASANKVRMGYSDMLSNASKSMTLASDAFQGNMDNAIRFQEIMAESYALGGASAEEMSTSMYQMIQALGSGTLAGDELRSVREGAPLAYKAIEEYVQGIMAQSDATKKYATQSLKDIASHGLVTSEMVVAAVMRSGKKMDEQFNKTSMTFEQAWDRIKNAAIKAFEPVSNSLNKMLNQAADNGAFEKIESAFWNISKALQIVFKVIYNTITWIADNWSWLQHLIIGGIMLLITYQIIKTAISIFCAYQEMKAWMIANGVTWQTIFALLKVIAIVAIVIMAIMALVYVFYLWKTGAIDTCQAIISALLIVGIAVALIGLLIGNWVVVIVGVVIAAIGLIIHWLDYFLAIIYSIGAAIYNFVIGCINALIQAVWSNAVEPIANVIEWFVNAFNGGFNGVLGGFANMCGQMLSMLIGLVKPFTKILDTLFGWDTTGAIESAQNTLKSWGKNENATNYTVTAPTIGSLTGGALPDRISYTNAWNKGMEHGSAAKDWLNDLGAKYQTGFDGISLDNLGGKLGLDFNPTALSFPNADNPNYDTSGAYKEPIVDDLLGDILNNTDDMLGSMELTDEDLEYLRKIAEMEWKKEYTTASIKVDMSNYNTISGDNDLDGIVTKLADKLYEELNVVADGVYA